MAWYRHDWAVERSTSAAFEDFHHPGYVAPYAGIYRCHGCGREIGIAQGHTLPPQNHHQHGAGDGPMLWRLTVYADHQPANQRG